MVPKVVSRGTSFKGAAKYFLHDKNADTSERVAWVETRNLQTENPETAWRIMSATAMDQKRLKQDAGIKATGRKSALTVQHLLISWHPDEKEGLTKDQMHAAAESAIAAIGASDHQAMLVAHDDTEKPHVHCLINRVSPIDGRLLSSSKEKLKLSAWAEKYEKDRGKIYCEERVINNAARRRGEYTRGVKSKARHIYELEKTAPANDNRLAKMRKDQRKQDARLSARGRRLEKKHRAAWAHLEDDAKYRLSEIRDDTRKAVGRAKQEVRNAFRPRWVEQHHEAQASMIAFEKREKTLLGRITNRFKSVDFGRIASGESTGRAIGEVFSAFTTRAGRLAAQKRATDAQEAALKREQDRAEETAAKELRTQETARIAASHKRYVADRMELVFKQTMEKAKLRSEWKKRDRERKAAHARFEIPDSAHALRPETVKSPSTKPAAAEQDNAKVPATKPSDLLPREDAKNRADQVDQFKDLLEKRAGRKQTRKRDRGDKDRGR